MDYSNQPNQNQNQNVPPVQPRNILTPKLIGLVIGLIILLGAIIYVIAGWYSQKNQGIDNLPNTNNYYSTTQFTLNPPKEGTYFLPPTPGDLNGYSSPAPNTDVEWNGDPQQIADLKLVLGYQDDYGNIPNLTYIKDINYYKMGMHGSNDIILAIAPAMDITGPTLLFFEKTPDGKYIFMSQISGYGAYGGNASAGYLLSPIISSADTAVYYNGILGPANLTWKGLPLEQPYLSPSDLFTNYIKNFTDSDSSAYANVTWKKVGSLDQGDLYLFQQPYSSDPNQPDITQKFYVKRYILKLKSGFFTTYDSRYTFFSGDSVPNITWLDGTKNQDPYRMEASLGGCGNPGAYVVSATDVSGLVKVSGTAGNGQPIYELKDKNHPTEKFFYDLIDGKIYDYNADDFTSISYQEWANHHPVIFYKNAVGEYAIFTNNKYGVAAECGKPVIYLYPTEPISVRVKVGADITKSEPEYHNGWQVYANPDGTLITADGNSYDSLFWEGFGHGTYPSITEGFVIPGSQIENALALQLKALGLNEKESSDFLEFWLPKMPLTPYVRLTWFTAQQLDELAPLIIWPKPDTTIRIFLDFEGLQNQLSLPEQHLTTLPRNGFTIVEWGGLLRK